MQRIGFHMLRRICTVMFIWGVMLWAHPALSEPYLAVRGGYKCSQCHTNITGGGKRNGFGSIYTQTTLPYKIISPSTLQSILRPTGASSGDPNYATFIANTLADFLSFGGDLRVENRTRFSEGPLETTNSLDVTEANLYIEARLLRDFLSFYVDEQLGPNAASSREVFGLIRAPRWWNFYVKGGKFLLPFGWRLQDDGAFIRDRTSINYANPDTGVEFGLEPGPLSLSLAVTNGAGGSSDDNRFKQLTLRAEAVFRHWRFGGSFAYNDTDAARRMMYGPFAGFSIGRFTLLGEVDVIEDRVASSGETIRQLAVFSSLNVLVTRGVNLKLSYEFLDPNDDVDNNERTRLTVGLEPFLTQFLQLRLFYRFNDGIPQRPIERADEVVFEFHLFFLKMIAEKGQPMARGVMILMLTLGLTLSHVGDRAIAQDRHQELDARVELLEQQARQERGQRLYRQACAPCHGVSGDGRGPAASGLHPKPHDFTTGMYKFRSTSMGAMPTDADLVRTIREGIPGTAMPAWKHLLSSTQQMALAQYLKTFVADAFAQTVSATEIAAHQGLAAPEATSERVQRGRHLYERLQCGQCRGSDGRGKGPLAQHLRDAWNRPIPPANFTRGIYKSGVAPEDLWRTIWTGLAGTPMPAWSGAISIEEGWDLVYYIRSLSQANTFWHQVFVDTGEAYPGR